VTKKDLLLVRQLFWAVLFLTFLTQSLSAQEQKDSGSPAPDSDLPSPEAIKSCLKGAGSAECLDNLFRQTLKNHTTIELLQLIERLETDDAELRRDCHPVVHAIGRETFRLKGNIHDSFSACDQTCHSGCYHGSVERFIRGDDVYAQTGKHPSQAELKQKANAACDPHAPLRLRYQCLHGLGHALMFFSGYDLDRALEACDALADDWNRSSCYGGVFMENVVNATNEKKNFSATDYHYPCNRVAAKYRRECYLMQSSRMVEMGLSLPRLFDECDKAGEYRAACALSVGRDLSNEARVGETQSTAHKCELAEGENRLACVRGVIYALIDNTWDGRYAMPFCAALDRSGDQESCFKDSIDYLRTIFEKSAEEIRNDCLRLAENSRRCTELAGR
jgi:hypothetical protein